MTTQKPEALRLADKYEVEGFLQNHRFAQDEWCRQAAVELRRLHAANVECMEWNEAARHEIESLRARVKELGEMLRENRSKRIMALEAENLGLLHALAAEQDANTDLRQQLESIGAGGVEPLRRRDHFRGVTKMVPLTDRAIQAARTADYDVEDAPENWAFALGVRFAERAHGITQEQK